MAPELRQTALWGLLAIRDSTRCLLTAEPLVVVRKQHLKNALTTLSAARTFLADCIAPEFGFVLQREAAGLGLPEGVSGGDAVFALGGDAQRQSSYFRVGCCDFRDVGL